MAAKRRKSKQPWGVKKKRKAKAPTPTMSATRFVPVVIDDGLPERGDSEYTTEMGERMLDWVSRGKPLREFCRIDGHPAWRTVYHWLEQDTDLKARFTHARILGGHAIAEEAMAIADTPQIGVRTEEDFKGSKEITEDMLGHRRLRVETRLKLLAKWFPQTYGDRSIQQNQTLDKDGNPITPGPTYIIDRREAEKIEGELEDKV